MNGTMQHNGKYKKGWILYQSDKKHGYGTSHTFETYEQALNAVVAEEGLETRIEQYSYALEEDQLHDCGEDE